MLLPKFTLLVLVYFIAGGHAHPAPDNKQKFSLKEMSAGKSLTASSFLTGKAPGATNSEMDDDLSAEENSKPESLPGGRALSLLGTNGTLPKQGAGNSSIMSELPKYAKLAAQSGRMFAASRIAPKEPETKLQGRAMVKEEGATSSVGQSTSGYMYSVQKWSSKTGDNDASAEESSSHIQIGNDTKELFAASMLGSKLGEYIQADKFNLKDFKKDMGAGGGTITRTSTTKQSGGSYQIGEMKLGAGEMSKLSGIKIVQPSLSIGGFAVDNGGGMLKLGMNQNEMKPGGVPISTNKQNEGSFQMDEMKLGAGELSKLSGIKIAQPPQTLGGFAVEDGGGKMLKLGFNQGEMKPGGGPMIRISTNKQNEGSYQMPTPTIGRADDGGGGKMIKLSLNHGEMKPGAGAMPLSIGGFAVDDSGGMLKHGMNQGEMNAGGGPMIRISTNKQNEGSYQIGEVKLGAGAKPPLTIGRADDGGGKMIKLSLNHGEMKPGAGAMPPQSIGGFAVEDGGGKMLKLGLNQGETNLGGGPIIRISTNKQNEGSYQIGEMKLGAGEMSKLSGIKIVQPSLSIGGFPVDDSGGMLKHGMNQDEMNAGGGTITRTSTTKQSGGSYQIGEMKLGAGEMSKLSVIKIAQPPPTIGGADGGGKMIKLSLNHGEMKPGAGAMPPQTIGGFAVDDSGGMLKHGLNQGESNPGGGPIIRISTNKQSGGAYQIGEMKLGAVEMSKLSNIKIAQPPQTSGFKVENGGGGMSIKLGLNHGGGTTPPPEGDVDEEDGEGDAEEEVITVGDEFLPDAKKRKKYKKTTTIKKTMKSRNFTGAMANLQFRQGGILTGETAEGRSFSRPNTKSHFNKRPTSNPEPTGRSFGNDDEEPENGAKEMLAGSMLGSKLGEYIQGGKFNLKDFKKDFGPGEKQPGGGTITRFSTHKQSGGSYQIGGFAGMKLGAGEMSKLSDIKIAQPPPTGFDGDGGKMIKLSLNQGETNPGGGPIIRISANKQSGGAYQIGQMKLGAGTAQPPQNIGGLVVKDGGGMSKIGLNHVGGAPPSEAEVDEEDGEGDAEDDDNGEEVSTAGDELIPAAKKRKKYKKTTTIKKRTKSRNFTESTANLQFRKNDMGQQGRSLSRPKPTKVFIKRRPTGDSEPSGRSFDNDDEQDELPKHAVLAQQTGRMFAASLLAPKKPEPGIRGRSLIGAPVLSTTTEKPKKAHTKAKLPGALKHQNDYKHDSTEDMPTTLTKKPKNVLFAPSVLQPKRSTNGHMI